MFAEGSEIGLQNENNCVDFPTSIEGAGCTDSTLENYPFNDSCPSDNFSNTPCKVKLLEPTAIESADMVAMIVLSAELKAAIPSHCVDLHDHASHLEKAGKENQFLLWRSPKISSSFSQKRDGLS